MGRHGNEEAQDPYRSGNVRLPSAFEADDAERDDAEVSDLADTAGDRL
jgi:hypothetical protein